MRTTPPTYRDLWRAGCVDEAHVRFGRRAGETHRRKHRQGAPVRPHHVNIRLEEHKLCLLVLIGGRADGRKELIALADGYRESTGSWADLLRDCGRRGMRAPVLAVGDGALGFWTAVREVFPQAATQRCWFHKIANVLGALPKSAHPGAKKALAEIWNAEDKRHAYDAVKAFEAGYGAKFPRRSRRSPVISMGCWRSMISRLSTGFTCALRIPLSRPS